MIATGLVLMLSLAAEGSASVQPLQAPTNVNVEPSTPAARELTTRAAKAEMSGSPAQALRLADEASKKAPQDPWPDYDKAAALAQMGKTDEAVNMYRTAEQKFAPSDLWGRSVAVYGRAHALSQAGRCDEARKAFSEYATMVSAADPKSAALARKYADDCKSPDRGPR